MNDDLVTNLIEEDNFHNAYYRAIRFIINQGTDLIIGGQEQRKPIRDSCMLISLTGNAINQIENHEIHPQYPFKIIDEYCKEFTDEYLWDYNKKSAEKQFAYLYINRLRNYSEGDKIYIDGIDQISMLRYGLEVQKNHKISSNRVQAITWIPNIDFNADASPCLQRIQIRYIPENKVDVHLDWRSRDAYSAWQANIICLIDMLNREVIKPNNCKIVRIIDYSDSLHIYKTDVEEAKKVKMVPVLL